MLKLKSANSAGLAIAGLVAMQLCVGSVAAQVATADKKVEIPATASEREGAANMTVAIDADTGQLRAATAEEIAAMREIAATRAGRPAAGSARSAVQAPMGSFQRQHATGARGARLTDEFAHLSLVVRRADGTYTTTCVHASAQEAALAHALPMSPKAKTELPTE